MVWRKPRVQIPLSQPKIKRITLTGYTVLHISKIALSREQTFNQHFPNVAIELLMQSGFPTGIAGFDGASRLTLVGSNPDPNSKNKTHNPYGLHVSFLVGIAGFEPTNDGVKVRCLTAWLYPRIRGAGCSPFCITVQSYRKAKHSFRCRQFPVNR